VTACPRDSGESNRDGAARTRARSKEAHAREIGPDPAGGIHEVLLASAEPIQMTNPRPPHVESRHPVSGSRSRTRHARHRSLQAVVGSICRKTDRCCRLLARRPAGQFLRGQTLPTAGQTHPASRAPNAEMLEPRLSQIPGSDSVRTLPTTKSPRPSRMAAHTSPLAWTRGSRRHAHTAGLRTPMPSGSGLARDPPPARYDCDRGLLLTPEPVQRIPVRPVSGGGCGR